MSEESEAYAAESRVLEILIGAIVPAAIASIFVLGRLYTRAFLTRHLGLDDALILFAWLAAIALSTIDCSSTNYGAGHHQSLQSDEDADMMDRLSYGSRMLCQLATGMTKLGLCAFYLRVFPDRKSQLYIYIFMGIIFIYTAPIQVYLMATCRPGLTLDPTSTCVQSTPDVYVAVVGDVFTNIMLLVFAISRLLPLQIAKRQKIALFGVASLGMLVIVAAIARFVCALNFVLISDRTWEVGGITTWSAIEVNTGLICASAPAIGPLLRKLTPGFLASQLDSRADSTRKNTQGSRSRPATDTLELDSQTDLHNGHSLSHKASKRGASAVGGGPDKIWSGEEVSNNKIWRGDDDVKTTHWDDSNSEEAVLGGIVKTVSVTVVNARSTSHHSSVNTSSVVSFEPV